MKLSDSQAREILLQYDQDPRVVLGMGAIAKALTNYGWATGWDTPNNNWYAVWMQPWEGECPVLKGDYGTLPSTSSAPGVCEFVYASPQQGITHMLLVWFPENDPNTPANLAAFYKAITEGDTNTVAQMVLQRAWGIPNRGMARDNPLATWTFASDFYNAANQIAANTGQTSHFQFPLAGLINLQVVPLPVQVVPVPLPNGQVPGTEGGGPDPKQPPPDKQPPPIKQPKEEKKSGGYGKIFVGGLIGLAVLGVGYKLAK